MQSVPFVAAARGRGIGLDIVVAVALALVLTVGWTLTDWPRLSRMLLPDPDDMMRLAQVRDWLAGQGTNDWTQYRMAPPDGSPMHWSRINDVGIAALILLATPLAGQADAEMIAVLVYPASLFALAMFLSARIGRDLWGPAAGPVAAVLTALAYPGTTVFIPGRIDHHALQVVLIQLLVLLLMRRPSWMVGISAGAVTATSLVVGLETAPQVAALVAVMAMLWVVRGMEEQTRLAGFAGGLGIGTLFFLVFLRPTFWTAALCDAFTPASSTAALAVAVALAALAAMTIRLPGWRARISVGALLGTAALGTTLLAFPSCIRGPYGEMDPFLLRAFMPFIVEANGVLAIPRATMFIATAGVMIAASVSSIWMLVGAGSRWPKSLPVAVVIATSAVVMLFQIRGVYIGATLGAPVLAGLILAARRRTTWQGLAVGSAWLVSAGMAYHTLPPQFEKLAVGTADAAVEGPFSHVVCSRGDAWRQVDHSPPGIVIAGTNVAGYIIGATHHSTIGAGYHRNDVGNMAMYRFFLSYPARSREIARQWNADYVVFCPGDFSEIDVADNYRNSVADLLRQEKPPSWLEPLPLRGTPLRFYKIR